MTPERWQQVDKLFQAALALDPADRSEFLDHACKGDAALRGEVEALINSHDSAGSFISSPAIEGNPSLIADSADSFVQQRIGPYLMLSRIGAGGMGEVFLAQDTRLGRKVALKVLPEHFTSDEQRVRRFQQEARAASALNHPNIITIYDIGELDRRQFIATEYVEGCTLRQRLAAGRMSLGETLDLAAQVASALTAAHESGITHRDIKPENIMIRPDGLVKLLDFGLAKLTDERQISLSTEASTIARVDTESGVAMGTTRYMSPEQARAQQVDPRTDVFSLGVVIYEMVAGRAPFEGETASDVIVSILGKEPTPLTRYEPEAPAELQRIVSKALAKDRDERYQTVKDLLIDLRKLKKGSIGQAGSESETIPGAPGRRKTISGVALASLIIAIAAIVYFSQVNKSKPIDSLAVLPFMNSSADPNAEYLSDGIAESIIYNMSQLPDLRVMSLSSVSSYKARDPQAEGPNPQTAGAALGVRAVLLGKVVQRGDGLSISVELVDARENRVLWGQQYNRKMTDILTVQDDISREVSDKLRLRLSGEEQKRLTRRYTDNAEAYRLYLLGRYFWNKRTVNTLKTGIEYFKQATQIDPTYALAYSGLADGYFNLSGTDATQPPNNSLQLAKEAALKAVQLDDALAEAHTSLGAVKEWFDWDFAGAETEYRRAIALNPGYATVHHRYGMSLAYRGRFDEALAEFKRALQIEPLSLAINSDLSFVYRVIGDYDRALEQIKRVMQIDATWPRAHFNLVALYEARGMYDEALAEIQRPPSAPVVRAGVACIYARQGRRDEAMKILKEMEELSTQRYILPLLMVKLYTTLGFKDQAFAWVQTAYEERGFGLPRINIDPEFVEVRSDPRVMDLLKRAGIRQ